MNNQHHKLKVKNLGIDTYRENIIFMRADCHVCVSEGFTALTRVIVHTDDNKIIATLNVVKSDIITNGEVALSIEAIKRLGVKDGDMVSIFNLSSWSFMAKKFQLFHSKKGFRNPIHIHL